jgi:hypothetical protein
VVEGVFEGGDPVVAPTDGDGVEEAGDAVASESAVEFGDEGFVFAAVAEEDLVRRMGGWGGHGYVSASGLEELFVPAGGS